MHFNTNVLIEFQSKERAFVETYVLVLQRFRRPARHGLGALPRPLREAQRRMARGAPHAGVRRHGGRADEGAAALSARVHRAEARHDRRPLLTEKDNHDEPQGLHRRAGCAHRGPARRLCDGQHRRRRQAHRHASPLLRARVPERMARVGEEAQHPALPAAGRLVARQGAGGPRQGRRADRDPLARLDARRLVRRAGGGRGAHGAPVQRLRRRHGAQLPGPLRPVRHAADDRRRLLAEGDRVRLRHAQGGRRRPADQLRRQVAGRRGLPADLRGAQPPQGGGVLPPAGGVVLRAAQRRHLPGGDRSAARHHARGGEPAALGQPRALPRHQVAVLARRRHGADARRAHGVFLQLPPRQAEDRAGRLRGGVPPPVLRHRERDASFVDGGAAQADSGLAGGVRQRLSVRADRHAGGGAEKPGPRRRPGRGDRKRQRPTSSGEKHEDQARPHHAGLREDPGRGPRRGGEEQMERDHRHRRRRRPPAVARRAATVRRRSPPRSRR